LGIKVILILSQLIDQQLGTFEICAYA